MYCTEEIPTIIILIDKFSAVELANRNMKSLISSNKSSFHHFQIKTQKGKSSYEISIATFDPAKCCKR